jgi:hypothetical protein
MDSLSFVHFIVRPMQVTDAYTGFLQLYPQAAEHVPLLKLDLRGGSRPFSLAMPDPQQRPRSMTSLVYWDGTGATWESLAKSPYDTVVLSFARFPEVALPDPAVHSGIVKAADLFTISLPSFASAAGIRTLRSKGKRVLVSFGGGDKRISQTVYSLAPRIFTALYRLQQHEKGTSKKFAEVVASFVRENGLDGIDIDNEETHISSFDLVSERRII